MRETLTFLLTGHETRPREGFGVLNFWLLAVSDVLLVGFAVFGFLLSWGAPWALVHALIGGTLGGFSVGAYRIAPADIVLGIVVFSAMVLLTRFLQRQLEESMLPHTRLDIGSRTAISAGVGYLGIGLALVTGVSIVGIDLSQMALIAGALSVGIGFGLQNVVNNFISGAILLAEQPIKIGDWIVVGNIEGNVRRINIRATEIETFNRASVIVPNADLLQTSVTNWTYKNRKGRVDIAVGVAYGSDPEEVEQILLECSRANENVIRWPEAYVLLQEFGDSSLNFELRVFVSDIEKRHLIASDLRKAIMRAFRARDIEIPFPRRDLWVHHEEGTAAVSNRPIDEAELFGD
jgi:small-conductance mechanosensitive channel